MSYRRLYKVCYKYYFLNENLKFDVRENLESHLYTMNLLLNKS